MNRNKSTLSLLLTILLLTACGGDPPVPVSPTSAAMAPTVASISTVGAVATTSNVDVVGGGVPTVLYGFNDPSVRAGTAESWNFDSDLTAKLPQLVSFSGAWTSASGNNPPSLPNAFCQSNPHEDAALLLSNQIYTNARLTVQFRLTAGTEAGLIFRAQDKNNYFLLTADQAQQSLNFYLYASSTRSPTKQGATKIAADTWQTLRVEVQGQVLRGYIGDQLVVETSDTAFFGGNVGLWANGPACFDNVQIDPL